MLREPTKILVSRPLAAPHGVLGADGVRVLDVRLAGIGPIPDVHGLLVQEEPEDDERPQHQVDLRPGRAGVQQVAADRGRVQDDRLRQATHHEVVVGAGAARQVADTRDLAVDVVREDVQLIDEEGGDGGDDAGRVEQQQAGADPQRGRDRGHLIGRDREIAVQDPSRDPNRDAWHHEPHAWAGAEHLSLRGDPDLFQRVAHRDALVSAIAAVSSIGGYGALGSIVDSGAGTASVGRRTKACLPGRRPAWSGATMGRAASAQVPGRIGAAVTTG